VLKRLREYFFPSPIRDRAALQRFISSQASYLAQRTSLEFSRNTLGYYNQHLWHNEKFLDAVRVSRWESFAALVEDMIVFLEGKLRGAEQVQHESLRPRLVALAGDILATYPLPPHRPQGWGDVLDRLDRRLAAAQAAPPASHMEIAKVSAQRFYDTMPVRSPNRPADVEVIAGAVRFGFSGFGAKLSDLLRPAAVVRSLMGLSTAPSP